MEEGLDLDNILSSDEVDNLFTDYEEETKEEDVKESQESQPEENEEKNKQTENKETTEVNVDSLFADKPEGVGSEESDKEEQEDTTSNEGGTSPKNNFYSSIAKAFAEEGIFPDLDFENISKIKTPEDLRDLVEQQINAGISDRQKQLEAALNAGMEPTEIKRYENTISYLNNISDDTISDESDQGETLRKQLIYQDFINRGYSKERAEREVKKSFDAGTDIDDAKEALTSAKDYFNNAYNSIIEESKKKEEEAINQRKEQAEKLRSSILEDKNVFGDLNVDKVTRKKIYENISKPVYKDQDTGELYTAIQKYEMENRTEFLKNVGLVFTLTDGFKNLDGLIKGKVRKEVKKGLRELEHTLNNTARTSDGSLKFVSGVGDDSESFIGKGFSLDV